MCVIVCVCVCVCVRVCVCLVCDCVCVMCVIVCVYARGSGRAFDGDVWLASTPSGASRPLTPTTLHPRHAHPATPHRQRFRVRITASASRLRPVGPPYPGPDDASPAPPAATAPDIRLGIRLVAAAGTPCRERDSTPTWPPWPRPPASPPASPAPACARPHLPRQQRQRGGRAGQDPRGRMMVKLLMSI